MGERGWSGLLEIAGGCQSRFSLASGLSSGLDREPPWVVDRGTHSLRHEAIPRGDRGCATTPVCRGQLADEACRRRQSGWGVFTDSRFGPLLQETIRVRYRHAWDVEDRALLSPLAVRRCPRHAERAGKRSALVIAIAMAAALPRTRDACLLLARRPEARSNSNALFDPFLLLSGMAAQASSVKADGPLIILPSSHPPSPTDFVLRLLQPQHGRAWHFAIPCCSASRRRSARIL